MSVGLVVKVFGKPAVLSALGAAAFHFGPALAGSTEEPVQLVATALTLGGPLLIGLALAWMVMSLLWLLNAKSGHATVCSGCGGPVEQRRTRWGTFLHCLNCGRSESIRD